MDVITCPLLTHFIVGLTNHSVKEAPLFDTIVHCNAVSHWLGTYTKWSLYIITNKPDCLIYGMYFAEYQFASNLYGTVMPGIYQANKISFTNTDKIWANDYL